MTSNPEPGGDRLTGLLITGIVVIFSDMISSIFTEEGVESRLGVVSCECSSNICFHGMSAGTLWVQRSPNVVGYLNISNC